MTSSKDELEPLIRGHFETKARDFPEEIPVDAFELEAVVDWMGDVRSRRILDLGCAKGRFVRALTAMGADVVGTDPALAMLRPARRAGGSYVQSTATRLPFGEGSFDGVICVEVIEHIPDVDRALDEIARVLKPGGRAILIDKNPTGIGYHGFTPNWLYKWMQEKRGHWFYPRHFPFTEQWHSAPALAGRLEGLFSTIQVRYLDGRVRGTRRRILAPLYRLVPALRPDIAWRCVK
ncbi:MAG: class I SAM-dependent methyltransferase [Candidatus Polarisedimenticolia bacterium]